MTESELLAHQCRQSAQEAVALAVKVPDCAMAATLIHIAEQLQELGKLYEPSGKG